MTPHPPAAPAPTTGPPAARPHRRARGSARARAGAFTLLEMVATVAAIGLLLGLALFGFASVQHSTNAKSGVVVLETTAVSARQMAATRGYVFPANLADRLRDRGPAEISDRSLRYTAGVSYAPDSPNNDTARTQVSVALSEDQQTAGYAVATHQDNGKAVCWVLLDYIGYDDRDTESTTWGSTEDAVPSQCTAAMAITCKSTIVGTRKDPTELGTFETC